MDSCIFHIDVNSAFLSFSAVKRLKEDPRSIDLRTIPSAVGGDIRTRHGVITAKSIPAKKFGIRTGEPVLSALRKCPSLVLIPSDFPTYREYSKAFIHILQKYSTELEQISIDEAFLDMGPLRDPVAAANAIKDDIRETLGFTVNVGVSTNKLLAKMASDFEKPDRVHTLWRSEISEKLWPLPLSSLYGCGKAGAGRLAAYGIHTIGDAAGTPPAILQAILGEKAGQAIWESANGDGSSRVRSVKAAAKSYSHELTTAEDITAANYKKLLPPLLKQLSERVAARMQRDEVRALTPGIMVKTGDFHRYSRQHTLNRPTNDSARLLEVTSALMKELLLGERGLFSEGQALRLVGVSAQNLDDGSFEQLSIFDFPAAELPPSAFPRESPRLREQRLALMMEQLDRRFGKGAVVRGDKLGRR